MELGCIAFGSEEEFKRSPRFLFLGNTLSPLQIDANALATLRMCAEYNQAAIITPAGSMVQANAEFLAGACVTQLLSPGMPWATACARNLTPSGPRALQKIIHIPIFSWGTLMDFAHRVTVHQDYYGHV